MKLPGIEYDMTYLAVSLYAKDVDSFCIQLSKVRSQGAEAIEIRADALNQPDPESVSRMIQAVQRAGLPVIVTCRDKIEGGFQEIDFSHRLTILRKAILSGADMVDIELRNFRHPDAYSVLKAALEDSRTRLILSCHNFDGPFDNLNLLYESMLALYPAAIPKLVYYARHINDCFAALNLLKSADTPAIVFCMGPAGQITRILSKKFGAFLTFACLEEEATAPGQIPVHQMKSLYRWDCLNSQTEIFGVVGNPVCHSLGPVLFNTCFDADSINAVFLPFLVEGEKTEFDAFLDYVGTAAGFGGFSVTMPHKGRALDYAHQHGDYVDGLAETIGSVNTLKIGFNGIISAYNTDYIGAMDSLTAALGGDHRCLHAVKVAVVGAGGVARAVVAGLVDMGARVTIYNRTVSKAQALANEFRCKAAQLDALSQTEAAVLINCTSVGMRPNTEGCPVPEGVLNPEMTVFDTVYNPMETVLLKKARQIGARTVSGAEMFIRQAMAQYRIFIGREPDEALMRKIVYDRLQAAG
ncbi:MAG: shikimate dehydrogenase [Phycisphaerae bacterium]|nr:shikimate dehydrogenase [Phycisphaerae bacterium]